MAVSRIVVLVIASISLIATTARAQDDAEKARRGSVARRLAALSQKGTPPAEGELPPALDAAGGGAGGNVAVAALSGIALLQSGSTPDAGPHRAQLNRCLDVVLKSSQASGLLASDNRQGPMYGHGFGMLFLSEAYVRSKDDAVRKRILAALEKAVALTEKTQNQEGGWRYQPKLLDADVSVTVGQLNGLLAAKAAGVRVSADVVKKAGDYVASCQNDDGGFKYMPHLGGGSGLPRSAAALCALQHAGAGTPQQRDKAVAFVAKFAPDAAARQDTGYVFYGHYYVAQALLAAGGEHRTKTSAAFREALVNRQHDDGSWTGDFDNTYATSMALIALQMPDGWLKVLEPKKP